MENREIAKEITVALISKVGVSTKAGDPQYPAKQVGEDYKIIYKAVLDAIKQS